MSVNRIIFTMLIRKTMLLRLLLIIFSLVRLKLQVYIAFHLSFFFLLASLGNFMFKIDVRKSRKLLYSLKIKFKWNRCWLISLHLYDYLHIVYHTCINISFLLMKYLLLCALIALALTLENGVGRTPPMGWNSWNKYHCNIN